MKSSAKKYAFTLTTLGTLLLLSSCTQNPSQNRSSETQDQDSTAVSVTTADSVAQDSSMIPANGVLPENDMDTPTEDPSGKEHQESTTKSPQVQFTEDGPFAIQVESWRNEVTAEKRADYWRKKGYADSYIVRYGNEETGDIWFRVQIGRVMNLEQAEMVKKMMMDEEQQPSWVVEM